MFKKHKMCSCYVKSRRIARILLSRRRCCYLHFSFFYRKDTEYYNLARSKNIERKMMKFLDSKIFIISYSLLWSLRVTCNRQSIKRIISRDALMARSCPSRSREYFCRVRTPFPRVFVASQSSILLQCKWKSIKTGRSAGSSCAAGRVVGLLPVQTNRERAWPVSLGNRRLLPSTR